jgi:aryl-alcohol dehydrogenase-like predicted oxidoreductase
MTTLGKTGPAVSRIGLGCMGMSGGIYGKTDDATSVRTIQAAIDAGVTLIDTGDFYGMGHNEMLIGRAIQGRRDKVVLSVKFGAMRSPDGAFVGFDGRPNAVKSFVAYSLQRLGVDHIDVYRPARPDPTVPIEETVGAIKELIQKGWVRHVGLSEVGVETIRKAHATHPIVDLQIEYAIATRGPEAAIFPALQELGIGATLYGVFSRGLLTGAKPSGPGDFRAYLPRFSGDAAARNADVVGAFARFAQDRGMTPAQLALSWVLAKVPSFVPIPGIKTEAQLKDALAALDKPLTAADVAALESIVPKGSVAGDRYGAEQMKHLDSER